MSNRSALFFWGQLFTPVFWFVRSTKQSKKRGAGRGCRGRAQPFSPAQGEAAAQPGGGTGAESGDSAALRPKGQNDRAKRGRDDATPTAQAKPTRVARASGASKKPRRATSRATRNAKRNEQSERSARRETGGDARQRDRITKKERRSEERASRTAKKEERSDTAKFYKWIFIMLGSA